MDRLALQNKTPEEAVEYFVRFLDAEKLRQAKPSMCELIDKWRDEKVNSNIKPIGKRTALRCTRCYSGAIL
ncbi:MAG TPA: hypothetical protein VM680_03085, partial [Verrucomicrobiae bacterium]|nr:hypothetical protein [Verrucomicrobiae bacterium]